MPSGKRGGDVKVAPAGYYLASQAARVLCVTQATLAAYVERGEVIRLVEPGKENGIYEQRSVDALAERLEAFALGVLTTSRAPQRLTYRRANREDIPGIWRNLKSFGWETASISQRYSWYDINPYIYYVGMYKNLVVGYISLFPHPPDVIEEQLAGRMRGWHIWPRHLLPFERGGTYDCFVGISVRQDGIPKEHYRRYAAHLIERFMLYIEDLETQHGFHIRRLYGMSAEPEGQEMAESLGFTQLPNQPGDVVMRHGVPGRRYVLDLEHLDSPFIQKVRARLARRRMAQLAPPRTAPSSPPPAAASQAAAAEQIALPPPTRALLADIQAFLRDGQGDREALLRRLEEQL